MATQDWLWLAHGLGPGAPGAGPLLQLCRGSAALVREALQSVEVQGLLTPAQHARLQDAKPAQFVAAKEKARAMGITLIPYDSESYPALLRHIPAPPPVLYAQGDISLLNGRLSIGVVGTRRPSSYGVEVVKTIGRGLAAHGAVITSGLAAGLDSEAHKAALAENAPTIACIAFGHDQCYPAANRRLMETIRATGLLLGEYPPGTTPEKPYFLQRNRLIAGISHGLLVTEARRYSGTMSTVNFAAEFGRDVFAVPGSIFSDLSSGTNALVREGAYLAATAEDVVKVYGIEEEPGRDAENRPLPALVAPPVWMHEVDGVAAEPVFTQQLTLEEDATLGTPATADAAAKEAMRPKQLPPMSSEAAALLALLGPKPAGLEALCEQSGIAYHKALGAMTELELAGLCEQLAGRRFRAMYKDV